MYFLLFVSINTNSMRFSTCLLWITPPSLHCLSGSTIFKNVIFNSYCSSWQPPNDERYFHVPLLSFDQKYVPEQTQGSRTMLVYCLDSVTGGGPTVNQHWVNVSFLQGWRDVWDDTYIIRRYTNYNYGQVSQLDRILSRKRSDIQGYIMTLMVLLHLNQ